MPQVENTVKKSKGDSRPQSPPDLSPYDSDSSLDPDTLVPKFVELQTRLYEIQPDLFDQPKKGGKPNRGKTESQSEDPRTAGIQRRIASIENDVLFDRPEAEYRWKEKLEELRKEAAFLRQQPQEDEPSPSKEPEVQDPPPETKAEPEDILAVDDGNEEQAGLFGEMFQREEPTLEVGIITEELNAAALEHRDFGKWTGLSPRRILEETCKARYGFPLFAFHTAGPLMRNV